MGRACAATGSYDAATVRRRPGRTPGKVRAGPEPAAKWRPVTPARPAGAGATGQQAPAAGARGPGGLPARLPVAAQWPAHWQGPAAGALQPAGENAVAARAAAARSCLQGSSCGAGPKPPDSVSPGPAQWGTAHTEY
jgi:hypothetical protein